MAQTIEKWLGYKFSTGIETGEDYKKFQRSARTHLKKQCATENIEIFSFHKNHYMFSAVSRNLETEKFVYISISDVRCRQDEWYNRVLIRTMKHEKDWTGGANHFCKWNEIAATAEWLSRA